MFVMAAFDAAVRIRKIVDAMVNFLYVYYNSLLEVIICLRCDPSDSRISDDFIPTGNLATTTCPQRRRQMGRVNRWQETWNIIIGILLESYTIYWQCFYVVR